MPKKIRTHHEHAMPVDVPQRESWESIYKRNHDIYGFR